MKRNVKRPVAPEERRQVREELADTERMRKLIEQARETFLLQLPLGSSHKYA